MRKLAATFIFLSLSAAAQFDPPAGQTGSYAVYKDSSAIQAWALDCQVTRGYEEVDSIVLGLASVGLTSMATGPSDAGVVSLGDGGSAILTFSSAIENGAGYDFAVFENGFSDNYLELAFVEVSSDGVNYFRFPATSNTQTAIQIGGFGYLDATKLNNLAGKYRAQYGTPFDLEELKNEAGLDVNSITHVKVIDVVGSIKNIYAGRDKNNNIINDPWPTPFASSGFDLEAVAVLHSKPAVVEEKNVLSFSIYPNPVGDVLMLTIPGVNSSTVTVLDMQGQECAKYSASGTFYLDVSPFKEGVYLLRINSFNKVSVGKFSKM